MKKIIVHVLAAVVSAGWADACVWKVPSWSPVLSAPDKIRFQVCAPDPLDQPRAEFEKYYRQIVGKDQFEPA